MAEDPVETYIADQDEPKRTTLATMRDHIDDLLPDAEHSLSYGVPAWKVDGKSVAGLASHANHLNYLPHSGDVVATLGEVLDAYDTTKGSVKFPIDQPLPAEVVVALVDARLAELGLRRDAS
jgi:uncharacterized protein YdhG (YjbR/CyaY superfamily)